MRLHVLSPPRLPSPSGPAPPRAPWPSESALAPVSTGHPTGAFLINFHQQAHRVADALIFEQRSSFSLPPLPRPSPFSPPPLLLLPTSARQAPIRQVRKPAFLHGLEGTVRACTYARGGEGEDIWDEGVRTTSRLSCQPALLLLLVVTINY